jgi:hypothetical protein
MTTIYRGLNVNLRLTDIVDRREALRSLKLDRGDLDVISGALSPDGLGLSDTINTIELRTLSGLITDQQKELYAIRRSASIAQSRLRDLTDFNTVLRNNIRIDNQIRAGAVKYQYYNYADNTITSADISTSRVSSWSTNVPGVADAPIFYGGDVEVLPNGTRSVLIASDLKLLSPPTPRLPYESITPTHLVTLNVNGVDRQFYAMNGIPLRFSTFFRNADGVSTESGFASETGLYYRVDPSYPGVPVWRIINRDNGVIFDSLAQSLNSTGDGFLILDTLNRPRTVELYYNPKGILQLGLPGINISTLPSVHLENLNYYNLQNNDLYEMPNFISIAPSLRTLIMSGNNLSRARDGNNQPIVANTQLQRLPATLENLFIDGCFSDSTSINISATCPSLRRFYMNAFYASASARQMTDTGTSPSVAANSIRVYFVRHQPYSRLSNTIVNSTTLQTLDIYACNITQTESGGFITLASTDLRSLVSYSNSHNLISIQGKSLVSSYSHVVSRSLNGGSGSINDINNVFDNTNTALSSINLSGTDAYGSIQSAFSSLPSLTYINLLDTRNSGSFNDNSFTGSNNVNTIYLRGGTYDSLDFFGTQGGANETGQVFANLTALRLLYIINNRNIRGELPSFENNRALSYIQIENTRINGPVPEFADNPSLRTVLLRGNNLSGSLPAFVGTNFVDIRISNNDLDGELPFLDCANLLRLYLNNNQLTGSVPLLSGCPRLQIISLANNDLDGYPGGALASNTFIRNIDLSNNNLSTSDASRLVFDLKANYDANPRANVIVNLLGNNIDAFPEETQEVFDILTGIYNWTILI